MYDKWTDDEVQVLIAVYGTEEIQRGFVIAQRLRGETHDVAEGSYSAVITA